MQFADVVMEINGLKL